MYQHIAYNNYFSVYFVRINIILYRPKVVSFFHFIQCLLDVLIPKNTVHCWW